MSRKKTGSRARVPRVVLVASLVLLIVTLVLTLHALYDLLRAGQYSVSFLALILGILPIVLAPLANYSKAMQLSRLHRPGTKRFRSWHIVLPVQVFLLIGLVLLKTVIFVSLADDLINQALAAENLSHARSLLDSAEILGGEVAPKLEEALSAALTAPNPSTTDDHVLQLAYLCQERFSAVRLQVQAAEIQKAALFAAETGTSSEAKRLVQVLAVLAPVQATSLARNFYNQALTYYTMRPPQTKLALTYIETFIAISDLPQTGLSQVELSFAYYLKGLVLELNSQPTAATDSYRQALQANDANIEARYALASILLVQVERGSEPLLLNEAIEVAKTGRQEYIPPEFCQDSHELDDPSTFQNTWSCFVLMTTEAGARLLRPEDEDETTVIYGLLKRAINLAESNEQFGEEYFTAEAYYWFAQLTAPDPATAEGRAVYCQIIAQHDYTKPRHRQWVEFANEQLDGHMCF